MTDTERLDLIERMLRRRDELHELWFDADARIFFAGQGQGDDLRASIDNWIQEEQRCICGEPAGCEHMTPDGAIRCAACGTTQEHNEVNRLVADAPDAVCCDTLTETKAE